MDITNNYERDDEKDDKAEGGGGVECPPTPVRLDQTSTLNPSVAGRTERPLSVNFLHNIAKSTPLVPAPEGPQPSSLTGTTNTILRGSSFGEINITLVSISSTSCHSVAVDVMGRAYG